MRIAIVDDISEERTLLTTTDWNLSFPGAMSIQIYLNMKMEKLSSLQRRNVLSL